MYPTLRLTSLPMEVHYKFERNLPEVTLTKAKDCHLPALLGLSGTGLQRVLFYLVVVNLGLVDVCKATSYIASNNARRNKSWDA